ncbi:HTH domain-containing protein [Niabella aquatica]
MSIKEQILRLALLHRLITGKKTGHVAELSKKLRVSERQVHNDLVVLKDMGAPIGFCRKCQTYYYKEEGGFSFTFCKY